MRKKAYETAVLRTCTHEVPSFHVQNVGYLSALGHFGGTLGTWEAETIGAFVTLRQTKPPNVLNQDTSQPFPEGQLRRSGTLGITPAQGRSTM